jgi:DNA-directed RNA polymerase II subunit RPB1
MEDIGIQYDGTVRNSSGEIIQFAYGEDGMDASRLEFQNVDLVKISKVFFCNYFFKTEI